MAFPERQEKGETRKGLQLEDLASYRRGFLVVFWGSVASVAPGSPSYIRSPVRQDDTVVAPLTAAQDPKDSRGHLAMSGDLFGCHSLGDATDL